MLNFDQELITDRMRATTFSFYTDEEVARLSIKEITNHNAFDHLGDPLPGGIYDKHLGVSPFDHRGSCATCGLNCDTCPGHVGHIELTAPIYNPFLMNYIYKLMKSLCFHCHKLRIKQSKIDLYTNVLALLKAGDIVTSQELKQYYLHSAKQMKLFDSSDAKSAAKAKKFLETALGKKYAEDAGADYADLEIIGGGPLADNPIVKDPISRLKKIERMVNERKEHFEHALKEAAESHEFQELTSTSQKLVRELQHEIWSQVITTSCPNCQQKSPGIRKDGYTKLFVKPLGERFRQAALQQERISSQLSQAAPDSDMETRTAEHSAKHSRKNSKSSSEAASNNLFSDDEQDSEIDEEEILSGKQRYLQPVEVMDHLEKLWHKESDLLSLMFGRVDPNSKEGLSLGPQMFFMKKVLVPPNRFRPESQGAFGGGGSSNDPSAKQYLHSHSSMLTRILNCNIALKDALLGRKRKPLDKSPSKAKAEQDLLDQNQTIEALQPSEVSNNNEVIQKWIQLQDAVNCLVDSSMAIKKADQEQSGLRQLLERKEGMFRMKMMGKRVNYGARSVISPDPYITTDQIGVPRFMAQKLTFPESVSVVNAERLRKAVINGSKIHPGANCIEDNETGQKIFLQTRSYQERKGLANLLRVGKKTVYRHLVTGDPLLVNRQPTLHKPSIMAHLARVLPKEQTIRMHYANCSTYNADFDGDEMNLHFPQNYLAISEAYKLMATHRQYIVPTSGKPIRGLIQDSVVSGVFLTSKDTFLPKETYMQLVYAGLRELFEDLRIARIHTLTPAVLKPKPLYTGKQVVTTLLKNIVAMKTFGEETKDVPIQGLNMTGKSKLNAKEWGPIGAEEGEVIVRDNELLQGTLDKSQFGSVDFGLVHSFYEVYGSQKAGELLTALARIFILYLQMHGFTCGLDDLVLTEEFNKKRRMMIEKTHKEGVETVAEYCGVNNYKSKDMNYSNRVVYQSKKRFDKDVQKFTDMAVPENPFDGRKLCIGVNDVIRQKVEDKYITGNKDTITNELDSAVKSKMSKATTEVLDKTIPHGLFKIFPKNNIAAMVMPGAKGSNVNMTQISCMLGQQELEGKRVPKMQTGRTLPCYLPHDPNPRSQGYISDRFISGLRPQDFYFHCMAGREGLIDTAVKTSRSGYLQRCLIKQLESLMVSYDMTVRDNDGSVVQFMYGEDGIDVLNTKYLDKFNFLEQNYQSLKESYNAQDMYEKVDTKSVRKYQHRLEKEDEVLKKQKKQIPERDPMLSLFHPQKHFGAISDKIEEELSAYIAVKGDPHPKGLKEKFEPINSKFFRRMYYMKYMKSVVDPGENVGTIAAQSVGEPSTQMTLNTFHLAGHGGANMTLGIPRLKEILMTTPVNIKTPLMYIHFKPGVSQAKMEELNYKLQRLRLVDVCKGIKVGSKLKEVGDQIQRIYTVNIEFDEMKKIEGVLKLKFAHLKKVIEEDFLIGMISDTLKQLKKSGQTKDIDGQSIITSTTKNTTAGTRSRGRTARNAQLLDDDGNPFQDEDDAIKKRESSGSRMAIEEMPEEEEDDDVLADVDGYESQKRSSRKGIRGYEEDDEDRQFKIGGIETERQENQNGEQVNLMQEKFRRYLQYIQNISFSEKTNSMTIEIKFPLEFKKVLMMTIAEAQLEKVLVRSVKGVERCNLIDNKGEKLLMIQGLNFDVFYQYSNIIDVNRIETNDIWQVLKKYGVEAARACLVKEIRSVFGAYGIGVDYRHLSLIADFMTQNGEYRAFNRIGMEESTSPFLKMSFETTMRYLITSAMTNDTDNLTTPASALVLGEIPSIGTGAFDLLVDPDPQH